jgi:hypothetical protein
MKVWFLQNRSGKSGKFFFTETAYLKATSARDTRKVFVFEMCDGGIPSNQYSEALFLEKERENQISTILGEASDFIVNFTNLKSLFEKLCTDTKATSSTFYQSKDSILKSFKIINDKKSFSQYMTNYSVKYFLLYKVSTSVEWYQALLKCHLFRDLPVRKGLIITDEISKNFQEAKDSLRKKKNKL